MLNRAHILGVSGSWYQHWSICFKNLFHCSSHMSMLLLCAIFIFVIVCFLAFRLNRFNAYNSTKFSCATRNTNKETWLNFFSVKELYWLPIQSRINFKVLLFAYQCFHQFGPSYLVELLTQYKPERTLRSSKKSLFCVPQTMTRSYGERSFSYAAPVLWNHLPEHVRKINTYESFRTSLKSHLFKTS